MRILFMGTPDIAAECLKALYAAGHEICGVYTRRDKPVGRKQILTAPPVKQLAVERGIPVYQPCTLRDGSSDDIIQELAPEIARYKDVPRPAILPIPGKAGPMGLGGDAVHRAVQRAVGSDIT